MAALADLVFDAAHPAAQARFWAAALDDYEIAPYDQAELARLRAVGVDDIEDDPTVLLVGPGPPRIFFQRVPEGKVTKNRLHLDLRSAGPLAEEVARLTRLGANVEDDQPNVDLIVLRDPEGNEFCLLR